MKAPFTREFLLKLFYYCNLTGNLIWKSHWNKSVVTKLKGNIAGYIHYDNHTAYRNLEINHLNYGVHRLIYFIETNIWPDVIDHIDGNGLNNHISNLRNVTHRQNSNNKELHRKGRLCGFHFCKTTKKWRSQITIDKKRIHLGRFETQKEAHERYVQELKIRGLL